VVVLLPIDRKPEHTLGHTISTIAPHSKFSTVMSMSEYMPLASTSLTEHNDDEDFEIKHGSKLPHRSNSFSIENRTTLVWLTILMAVMAILAAASFHITILSTPSSPNPIRSPNDITSNLRIVYPSPNLDKGRTILKQKKLKSELMLDVGVVLYLLTSARA
jgi:hypothetical protein